MISSHHENNYAGAVRNLNRAEQELSHITADTPPFVVAALRDQELTFRNSKTLVIIDNAGCSITIPRQGYPWRLV
jgi:Fe-Mn family superoxide dismutase